MSLQFIGLQRRDVVALVNFLRHLTQKPDVDLEAHPKILKKCGEKRLHRRTVLFNELMLWLGYYRELRFHNPDLSSVLEEFEVRCAAVARRGYTYPFGDRGKARDHLAVLDRTEFDTDVRHDAEIVERALVSAVILAKMSVRETLVTAIGQTEPIAFVHLKDTEVQRIEENLEGVRRNMFCVKPLDLNLDRHANTALVNAVNKLVYTGRLIMNVRRSWEELERKCLARIQERCKLLVKELRMCLSFDSNYCRNILKHAVENGDSADTLLELLIEDFDIYVDSFPQSAHTFLGARSPSLEFDDDANLLSLGGGSAFSSVPKKHVPTQPLDGWSWIASPWKGHKPFRFEAHGSLAPAAEAHAARSAAVGYYDEEEKRRERQKRVDDEVVQREKQQLKAWEERQQNLQQRQQQPPPPARKPSASRRLFGSSADEDDDDDDDDEKNIFTPIKKPGTSGKGAASGGGVSSIFSGLLSSGSQKPTSGPLNIPQQQQRHAAFSLVSPQVTKASPGRVRRDSAWDVRPLTETRGDLFSGDEDSDSSDGYPPNRQDPRFTDTLVDITDTETSAKPPVTTAYKFEQPTLTFGAGVNVPAGTGAAILTPTPVNPSTAPAPAPTPTFAGTQTPVNGNSPWAPTAPLPGDMNPANWPRERAWALKNPHLAYNPFRMPTTSTASQNTVSTTPRRPSTPRAAVTQTASRDAADEVWALRDQTAESPVEDSEEEDDDSSDTGSVVSLGHTTPSSDYNNDVISPPSQTPEQSTPSRIRKAKLSSPMTTTSTSQKPVLGKRVATPHASARAQTVTSTPVQGRLEKQVSGTPSTVPATLLQPQPASSKTTSSRNVTSGAGTSSVSSARQPSASASVLSPTEDDVVSPATSPLSMLSSASPSPAKSAPPSPVKGRGSRVGVPSLKPTLGGKAVVGRPPSVPVSGSAPGRLSGSSRAASTTPTYPAVTTVYPPSSTAKSSVSNAPPVASPSILKPGASAALQSRRSTGTAAVGSPVKSTTGMKTVAFDLSSPQKSGTGPQPGSAGMGGAKTPSDAVQNILQKIEKIKNTEE